MIRTVSQPRAPPQETLSRRWAIFSIVYYSLHDQNLMFLHFVSVSTAREIYIGEVRLGVGGHVVYERKGCRKAEESGGVEEERRRKGGDGSRLLVNNLMQVFFKLS